jgi:hypothetical protein
MGQRTGWKTGSVWAHAISILRDALFNSNHFGPHNAFSPSLHHSPLSRSRVDMCRSGMSSHYLSIGHVQTYVGPGRRHSQLHMLRASRSVTLRPVS